jgi:hypothetical protein
MAKGYQVVKGKFDTNAELRQKEWSAEGLMAVGALFLGSFLVFIYFVSP